MRAHYPVPAWRPELHAMYPLSFREAVATALLVSFHYDRGRMLSRLPFELLCCVFEELAPHYCDDELFALAICRVCPPSEGARDRGDAELAIDYRRYACKEVINFPCGELATPRDFLVDKVFPPAATSSDVFAVVSPLVQRVVVGGRVAIFAYGQTGTGKTHTMRFAGRGPQDAALQGLMYRCSELLIDEVAKLRNQGWTVSLTASFLELYNENIYDCFHTEEQRFAQHNLKLRESPLEGVFLSGVTEVPLNSTVDTHRLLETGRRNLNVKMTHMSQCFSRSSTVLMLKVVGRFGSQEVRGHLNLIDLAGSERVPKSGVGGEQLREAMNINKSLVTLGRVITCRADKTKHVPYRDSKLTRLLQNTLEPGASVVVIGHISSSEYNKAESEHTLKFLTYPLKRRFPKDPAYL